MENKSFEKEFIKESGVYKTKVTILKAAAQEFANKGYGGTAIRNIATVAGVPHSSITYHFGNKKDLFETVVGNLFQETFNISNTFKIESSSKNIKQEFIDYLNQVAIFYYENPEFLTIIHRERMDVDEPLQIISKDLRKLKDLVRGHLIKGQELGLFKEIPIDSLQLLFSGAFQSLFVSKDFNLSKLSKKKVNEVILNHVTYVVELLEK